MSEEARQAFYSALLDDDAEQLYEQAPCGYLSTTPDGLIIKVNQTFLTLTGHERPDVVGRRRFADLLTAGGRIYHETHLAPMLQMQDRAGEIALDLVSAGGGRLPVLVNAVLERGPDGRPVVIRMAVFDATHRREYERELLRAKQRAEVTQRQAEAAEQRAAALARTLQQTLIPPTPPTIPELDVAAAYRPAGTGEEVGGDFYDVFEIADGDWVAVVGDVCGKGTDAAVITALARSTLRAAAVRSKSPAYALRVLNDALVQHATERFCTAAMLRLSRGPDGWSAVVGLGGHPRPLYRAADGTCTEVGRPGTLLGIYPEPSLTDVPLPLEPGASLLAYTDGVTEGRRGREFYGDARLHDRLRDHGADASTAVEAVLADVLRFQSGDPSDDIVLLALHVPGPGPAA